jgi:hypothetical protein
MLTVQLRCGDNLSSMPVSWAKSFIVPTKLLSPSTFTNDLIFVALSIKPSKGAYQVGGASSPVGIAFGNEGERAQRFCRRASFLIEVE